MTTHEPLPADRASETSFGLLAEFGEAERLVEATGRVHDAGFRRFDSFAPMPVEGLAEAMNFRKTAMPLVMLLGAIIGGLSGYAFQYWVAVIAYPVNVGGRPFHSWPSFIPVTFELTILCGAIAGVLGMLALNGLPRPHHPLFNVPAFLRASRDRFFLCIEATDPRFETDATRQFLLECGAEEVYDVPR